MLEIAKKRGASNSRKRKEGEVSGISSSGNSKKKKSVSESGGLQRREVSSNECAACFGLHEEDIDLDSGDVMREWIQCTEEDCSAHRMLG